MGAIHFSLDPGLAGFFRDRLPIDVFVETGTFRGDSVEAARHLFPTVYSVEQSEHYYRQARERFRDAQGVLLVHGSSTDFLRERRERFADMPVLFWLDAHWCCADHLSDEESQSPLLEEIEAIDRLHPQSVVLIDDARLYLCPPPRPHRYTDWPDWHDLSASLIDLSHAHRLLVLNDVVLLYPAELREPLARYAFDHGVDWLALTHRASHGKARRSERSGMRSLFTRRGRS